MVSRSGVCLETGATVNLRGGRHEIIIEWDERVDCRTEEDPIPYEDFRQWVALLRIAKANARTNRVLERWWPPVVQPPPQGSEGQIRKAARIAPTGPGSDSAMQYSSAMSMTCVVSKCIVSEVWRQRTLIPFKGRSHDLTNALSLPKRYSQPVRHGYPDDQRGRTDTSVSRDAQVRVGRYHGKGMHVPKGCNRGETAESAGSASEAQYAPIAASECSMGQVPP